MLSKWHKGKLVHYVEKNKPRFLSNTTYEGRFQMHSRPLGERYIIKLIEENLEKYF